MVSINAVSISYKRRTYSQTLADKDCVVDKLAGDKYCPGYKKGDQKTTYAIAERYETGIENGKWSLKRIEDEFLRRLYNH